MPQNAAKARAVALLQAANTNGDREWERKLTHAPQEVVGPPWMLGYLQRCEGVRKREGYEADARLAAALASSSPIGIAEAVAGEAAHAAPIPPKGTRRRSGGCFTERPTRRRRMSPYFPPNREPVQR